MKLVSLLLFPIPWNKIWNKMWTKVNPLTTEVKRGDAALVGISEEGTLVAAHVAVVTSPDADMHVAGAPAGVKTRVSLPRTHLSSDEKTPFLEFPDSKIPR